MSTKLMMNVAFAALTAWTVLGVEVKSWPAPVVRTAPPLTVRVNGQAVETVTIPQPDHCLTGANARPYSAALFEADGEVEVEVSGTAMKDVRILPLSRGIRPEITEAQKMRFRATPPFTVAVEPSGRHHALIVSAERPDPNAPRRDDPNVVWFGPGSHFRDKPLTLTSGQTLYLAPGAYLESAIVGLGTNITICGHGILSGTPWAHSRGPQGAGGQMINLQRKNVTVRDVTIMGSYGWTLVVSGEDILIDNVKILNGRVLNDDGIDVCRARRVTIRNCFIRSQDDCITPKWWCEDLLVENCALWTDVANIFRIGYECDGPKTFYRNFTIRNTDVLHQSIRKVAPSAYWSENTIFIQCGNDQRFGNFTFDGIRFDTPEAGDVFLNMRTFKVNDPWQHHKLPGSFDGLVIRNVRVEGPQLPQTLGVRLASMDRDHRIDNVRFEKSVSGLGELEVVGDVRGLDLPKECFRAYRKWTPEAGGVKEGVVWVDVVPQEISVCEKPGSTGLRIRGKNSYWGLSLLRHPGSNGMPGKRTFEFEHNYRGKRFAPLETCLYSRMTGEWKAGKTYRLALFVGKDRVEAAIRDLAGNECFAEGWTFGKHPVSDGETPTSYVWGEVKAEYGDFHYER